MQTPPPPLGGQNIHVGYQDNAIGIVNGVYKFESGMRVELELGFDQHDVSAVRVDDNGGFGPFPAGRFGRPLVHGGEDTTSFLVNFAYDFALGDGWGLSVGGGVGGASVNE